MVENPYESPKSELASGGKTAARRAKSFGLSILAINSFLVFLAPPTCCPCGLGPIGFLIQPYLLLLGFPTILIGLISPEAVRGNPAPFLIAYIINMAFVSYLLGHFASKILALRGKATQRQPGVAAMPGAGPSGENRRRQQ